ncbi:YggS family pyridoxal phosphate-dependent enzyme [Sphingomicrobium aestuariivivum]|uniref:YggS family pyridoxal phosphate-dependent enzyme n=1 Tax=Sphingomicrobium aestuariivivum TaxID=1582356 RepID=UPI001FD63656|nr:YggS family pyridoxal phosphate-dependent enzyme [Sphingomicrobium aestuariivivum]MCJ8191146.1 YggS family pyridoxal phosphate-dependent enzyme [Sphingomicrobium aestuariivivum]
MHKLEEVKARIALAAKRSGRDTLPTLVAVSKTRSAEEIRPLLEAGQRDFGENRVQEAADKWPALREEYPDVRLHMVGQLQSNKAEEAVALFDAIHSLDRPSLLKAIAKAVETQGRQPDLYVQVNIGAEEQKGGVAVTELGDLLAMAKDKGLKIKGLMCIPPAELESSPFFALLAELARRHGVDGLSMGMTHDVEEAAMLGATAVRVGTALFGPRG